MPRLYRLFRQTDGRRRIVLVLLVLAVAGCGSSDDPAAVPDLTGMDLPAARDAADDAQLELSEVDASGDGRVVFSPSNWTVERQDPTGGVEVAPGSTVTVWITNARDQTDDPEPEPEPEEVADEPAEQEVKSAAERVADIIEESGYDAEEAERNRSEREPARTSPEPNWMARLSEDDPFAAQYVDRVEESATTVRVHMNMGDARQDGLLIGEDGLTDRSMAMQLCFWVQSKGGVDVDVLDVRGHALVRTGPSDKQCKIQ